MSPFGYQNGEFAGQFTYESAEGSTVTSTSTGIEYPNGGSIIKMEADKELITQKVQELQRDWWIDMATRVIFVEFNTCAS